LYQFRGNLNLWKKTGDLCLNDGEFYDDLFNNDYNAALWGENAALVGGETSPSSLFLSWVLHRARRIATMKALNKEYGHLFPRGIPFSHTLFFLLEDAIDWIKYQVNDFPKPFLGYVHLWPPHDPYNTRRDFIDAFRDGWKPLAKSPHFFSQGKADQLLNRQRREYDEYLAYTDAEFGRLFDSMEQSGLLENTYLILTSDHGEMFERGIRGHTTPVLNEPLIRIPLLISKPGQRQREDIRTLTSCVDLLPTLLHVTGQPIPDWCEGRILPTFDDQKADSSRAIFVVEAKANAKHAPLTNATMTIIKDQHKLIHYFGYDKYENEYELYNLANDPEEVEDLYASKKSLAANLQDELMGTLTEVNESNA
jgi:arylsulfatase A-like enzyme